MLHLFGGLGTQFRVQGLGSLGASGSLGVQGLGFREFRVEGVWGFRALGFRVQGLGFKEFRVSGL